MICGRRSNVGIYTRDNEFKGRYPATVWHHVRKDNPDAVWLTWLQQLPMPDAVVQPAHVHHRDAMPGAGNPEMTDVRPLHRGGGGAATARKAQPLQQTHSRSTFTFGDSWLSSTTRNRVVTVVMARPTVSPSAFISSTTTSRLGPCSGEATILFGDH